MRTRYWLPALVLGLAVGALAVVPAPAADKVDPAKIEKLIKEMGSSDFAEREKATKALDAIGEPALEALKKAMQDDELEIRRRAEDLVKKIEKRTQSDKILTATKIHLVFKDTPVTEAVAEIQKKTGFNIYLHDPEGKLKDRKVTLDTGETTFWNAFEQFCQKAGLGELTQQDLMRNPRGPGGPLPPGGLIPPGGKPGVQPLPADRAPGKGALNFDVAPAQAPAVPAPPPVPPGGGGGFGGGGIAVGPGGIPFMPGQPGQIILTDAKDRKEVKEAADVSGAVRIKSLAKSEIFGNAPEGQALLTLLITPEPKLQWQQTIAVRVEKAIDDQDQKLTQVMQNNPGGRPGIGGPGGPGGGPAIAPPIARPPVFWGGASQYAPVYLKKGEKAAKALKELSGVVQAQVLTASQPMITVDNVLKASGKTIKGTEGGSLKIVDVSKGENGLLTIRFELDPPANVIPDNGFNGGFGLPGGIPGGPVPLPAPGVLPKGALNFQVAPAAAGPVQVIQVGGGGIVVGGGPVGMPFFAMNGLSVVDDKNKPIQPLVLQQVWQNVAPGGNAAQEFIFVCQLEKGQDAVKLVFNGRKSATIEVPFTLKDVTLP
jgi:hypothetical protein